MTPIQSAIDRLKRFRAGEPHHTVYPKYDYRYGSFHDQKLIVDAVLDGSLVAEAVADAVAQVTAELKMWKPMTSQEAEEELDKIEAEPLDEAEINRIVEMVTDPTFRPSEPQHVLMAAKIRQLEKQLAAEQQRVAEVLNSDEIEESIRVKIQEDLVRLRDGRCSLLNVGNGLCIREKDGTPSSAVRLSTGNAVHFVMRELATRLGLDLEP